MKAKRGEIGSRLRRCALPPSPPFSFLIFMAYKPLLHNSIANDIRLATMRACIWPMARSTVLQESWTKWAPHAHGARPKTYSRRPPQSSPSGISSFANFVNTYCLLSVPHWRTLHSWRHLPRHVTCPNKRTAQICLRTYNHIHRRMACNR